MILLGLLSYTNLPICFPTSISSPAFPTSPSLSPLWLVRMEFGDNPPRAYSTSTVNLGVVRFCTPGGGADEFVLALLQYATEEMGYCLNETTVLRTSTSGSGGGDRISYSARDLKSCLRPLGSSSLPLLYPHIPPSRHSAQHGFLIVITIMVSPPVISGTNHTVDPRKFRCRSCDKAYTKLEHLTVGYHP